MEYGTIWEGSQMALEWFYSTSTGKVLEGKQVGLDKDLRLNQKGYQIWDGTDKRIFDGNINQFGI